METRMGLSSELGRGRAFTEMEGKRASDLMLEKAQSSLVRVGLAQ